MSPPVILSTTKTVKVGHYLVVDRRDLRWSPVLWRVIKHIWKWSIGR